MKSLNRKVSCAIALASALLIRYQRVVNFGFAAAVILFLAAEEHARRTWRDRAMDAQMALAGAAVELSALRDAAQAKGVQ